MVASGGWHCKELIGGAIISVAVAACFFAAFIAAALWLPQDQPTIRRHIVAAVLDGTFNARPGYGPLGATIFPRHTLDCTLANMMLAPPAGRLADAISNRHVALNPSWSDPRVPATADCQGLARAIPELGPGYGDVQYVASDRYILGVRVAGRVLLSLMPFDTMARTLQGISFALLGVLGALALWKLRAAPDAAARQSAIGYLIIALCLALLYGVHWFDATLYFAPPDHVHFAFIIVSLLAPLARMRLAALALTAASYGSLIAIFESLTGGIPFALAMLPLLLALGFEGDRREYLARLFLLWGAFCIAVVTCFALKKILVIAFLGDQESFSSLLVYRMFGAPMPESGTTAHARLSALELPPLEQPDRLRLAPISARRLCSPRSRCSPSRPGAPAVRPPQSCLPAGSALRLFSSGPRSSSTTRPCTPISWRGSWSFR